MGAYVSICVPLANVEDRPRTAIDTEAATEAETVTVQPSAARARARSRGIATASSTLDSVSREVAAARFEREVMPRGAEEQQPPSLDCAYKNSPNGCKMHPSPPRETVGGISVGERARPNGRGPGRGRAW